MSEKKVQQYKKDAAEVLKASFDGVKGFVFADYRGLTVGQVTQLRGKLREVNAEFHVVKNNYAKIAFKMVDHEDVAPFLSGPTALAYVGDEMGPVAKALFDFGKEAPVTVKGGLLEEKIFDAEGVEAFSKLPTRIELLQMLMSSMKAPVNNLVYVLNGVTEKLVRTLDAVREQKAQQG